MNTFRKFVFILVFLLALISRVNGQDGDAFKQMIIAPGNLKWTDMPNGAQRAVLFGDPSKPGPYTMRMKFPPNSPIPPHSHPDNRQVTLLSGTLYLGQGNKLDRETALEIQPGTFFTEPRGVVHYGYTGNEQVITQVYGTGPTSTDYVK